MPKKQTNGDRPARRGRGGAIWQGSLRLSLVSCPVAVYNATTREHDVSFHLIHPKTHNRIRMIPHDPELGEVSRSDLVKGFEIAKNQYVTLTEDEIRAVRLKSTDTIDIEQFVEAGEVDRIYWKDPYYLAPDGESAAEAYAVIRDAMGQTKRLAIGRVVMHTRERQVVIEPRGRGLLMTTLRSRDEIRAEKEIFDRVPADKADRRMVEIANKIIEQQASGFDPTRFEDHYEEALRELIEQKRKGRTVVAAEPPKEEKVIDLMDALSRSLGRGGQGSDKAKRFLKARRAGGAKRRAAG